MLHASIEKCCSSSTRSTSMPPSLRPSTLLHSCRRSQRVSRLGGVSSVWTHRPGSMRAFAKCRWPASRRSRGRCALRSCSACRPSASTTRASRAAALPRRARRAPPAAQAPRHLQLHMVLKNDEAGLSSGCRCSWTTGWMQLAGPCKKSRSKTPTGGGHEACCCTLRAEQL